MSEPNDTAPAVAAVQLELLRQAGPGRRAALARSLSRTTTDLSRRALRERMAGATEEDVMLRTLRHDLELAPRRLARLGLGKRRGRKGEAG